MTGYGKELPYHVPYYVRRTMNFHDALFERHVVDFTKSKNLCAIMVKQPATCLLVCV